MELVSCLSVVRYLGQADICSSAQAKFTRQSPLLLDFSASKTWHPVMATERLSLKVVRFANWPSSRQKRRLPGVLPSYPSAFSDSMVTGCAVWWGAHIQGSC